MFRASHWWSIALVFFLIFLVPSNLFFAFPDGSEYVHGLRIDYLIPKLYLSDLIAGLLIVTLIVRQRTAVQTKIRLLFSSKRLRVWVLLCVGLTSIFTLRQVLSPVPLSSVAMLFRYCAGIVLLLLLTKTPDLIKKSYLLYALICTVLMQTAVALYQWSTQTSVFGYQLLGEPNLSIPLSLAKTVWQGRELILPYGTTAHPNVLAGVLAVYLVAIVHLRHSIHWRWSSGSLAILAVVLGGSALLLTQSVSGIMALVIGLSIVALQTRSKERFSPLYSIKASVFYGVFVIGSILVVQLLHFGAVMFPANDSIVRRAHLNSAAIQQFIQRPLVGSGLTIFTYSLDKSLSYGEVIVPFVQPAHNVFILLLGEVAVLGFAVLWSLRQLLLHFDSELDSELGSKPNSKPILQQKIHQDSQPKSQLHSHTWFSADIPTLALMLLPIAWLDHYLITLQSGILLLVITPLLIMKVPQEKISVTALRKNGRGRRR